MIVLTQAVQHLKKILDANPELVILACSRACGSQNSEDIIQQRQGFCEILDELIVISEEVSR